MHQHYEVYHDDCYSKLAVCHFVSALGGGGSRRLGWIRITFMWTEKPAAVSLLGSWCLYWAHTDGCRDWIQIRCLREAELHGNEGFLRDRSRVDPSLLAATGVYTAAGQTEWLSLWWATDPRGLYHAIRVTSLFNADILRSCTILHVYIRLK